MSDVQNIVPINVDDTLRNKLIVIVDGEEVQINYDDLDLTFNSLESEIMSKVVPIIIEEKGIDITDTYKIRKTTDNENIFIYPNSTAG